MNALGIVHAVCASLLVPCGVGVLVWPAKRPGSALAGALALVALATAMLREHAWEDDTRRAIWLHSRTAGEVLARKAHVGIAALGFALALGALAFTSEIPSRVRRVLAGYVVGFGSVALAIAVWVRVRAG